MSLRARSLIKNMPGAPRAIVTALDCASPRQLERLKKLAATTKMPILAVAEATDEEWAQLQSSDLKDAGTNLRIERLDCRYGRLGRGAALRYGLRCIRAELIAIINNDEDISAETFERCFAELDAKPVLDFALTFRRQNSTCSPEAKLRQCESALFNIAARVLFLLPYRDVQSPVKVFRRAALEKIFERLRLYNHGFDAELLFNARQLQLKYVEIESPWTPQFREWDVFTLAISAIVSLVNLRLVSCPLGSIPGVQLMGRKMFLPFKSHYKIMIFCWRDPKSPVAGGAEVYLFEQARAWARLGHDVTWLAQSFATLPNDEILDGVKVVRRGRSLLVFPCAVIWYLLKSGTKFDFIIDTMNGIPFFTPLFSIKPKICLLFHVHSKHFMDEFPRPLGHAAQWVETKLVPFIYRQTRFITISQTSLNEMQHYGISSLPISLVHSGVANEFKPGPKAHKPTIVYVGRLRKYKQIRKLIDAFRNLSAVVPDLQLIIAGSGDDEEHLRTYASGDVGIEFRGQVSETEKRSLMSQAWVFAMPSAIEGWGLTVIEAAASGTPTVAFGVSALRESVLDGVTGLLSKTDDEFAENLGRVITEQSLRSNLGRAAVVWASQFSWDQAANLMLEEMRISQPWRAILEAERGDLGIALFDDVTSPVTHFPTLPREFLDISA